MYREGFVLDLVRIQILVDVDGGQSVYISTDVLHNLSICIIEKWVKFVFCFSFRIMCKFSPKRLRIDHKDSITNIVCIIRD